ncbi:MAG: hypothetical protein ACK5HT_17715, partial [Draconibacterium sp.]
FFFLLTNTGLPPVLLHNVLSGLVIKKILEVDYPRGRAKEYSANFISAKSLKIDFSLFHPSVSHRG